jgi:hypothetical protein
MGGVWYSDGSKRIRAKRFFFSNATGRVPANALHVQTGTSGQANWAPFWERATTPPPTPDLNVTLVSKTRNVFSVSLTMPSSDIAGRFVRAVVKVGIGVIPNPPSINDGTYYSEKTGSEPWSEWFTDQVANGSTIPGGYSGSKMFPNAFQSNISVPLNTNVTFAAWVQNEYGVWSAVNTQTVKTLAASDPLAGGIAYTTVIAPSGFDDWSNVSQLWQFRDTVINNVSKFIDTTAFVRSPANPRWWMHTGGNTGRQSYLFFGTRLRSVCNAAYEVKSVKITMTRRLNTAANLSGGVIVYDAARFGSVVNTQLHVWAATPSVQFNPGAGSTSDLIAGTDSVINVGSFPVGTTKTIEIPKKTWSQFIDGAGNKANSLGFYDPAATGDMNDPLSLSWAAPGVYNGEAKLNKDTLSGYVTVEWVGYDGNPWPTADPSHPSFVPLGLTSW